MRKFKQFFYPQESEFCFILKDKVVASGAIGISAAIKVPHRTKLKFLVLTPVFIHEKTARKRLNALHNLLNHIVSC